MDDIEKSLGPLPQKGVTLRATKGAWILQEIILVMLPLMVCNFGVKSPDTLS